MESTELEVPPEPPVTGRLVRCTWAESDPLLVSYHDQEWGIPELDSRALWEALVLDTFQAGLSWLTILRKRASFRAAFEDFDPAVIARYGARDIARLMRDEGIVRSRPKIVATIENARAYERMHEAGEDLASLVWSVAGGPRVRDEHAVLSVELAEMLIERGYRFVGPLVVQAWLRAAGVLNEHDHDCFRRDASLPDWPFAT